MHFNLLISGILYGGLEHSILLTTREPPHVNNDGDIVIDGCMCAALGGREGSEPELWATIGSCSTFFNNKRPDGKPRVDSVLVRGCPQLSSRSYQGLLVGGSCAMMAAHIKPLNNIVGGGTTRAVDFSILANILFRNGKL